MWISRLTKFKTFIFNSLFSSNCKKVSLRYFIFGSIAAIGGMSFLYIRMTVSFPEAYWLHPNNHLYNVLLASHNFYMVFFVIMPVFLGGFGNWFVPLMIGAPDVAFPRINNINFWLLPIAVILLCDVFVSLGWTGHPPLSSITSDSSFISIYLIILSCHIAIASSVITALNLIYTIFFKRADNLRFRELPLFVGVVFISAVLLLLSLPILARAIIKLLLGEDSIFFNSEPALFLFGVVATQHCPFSYFFEDAFSCIIVTPIKFFECGFVARITFDDGIFTVFYDPFWGPTFLVIFFIMLFCLVRTFVRK